MELKYRRSQGDRGSGFVKVPLEDGGVGVPMEDETSSDLKTRRGVPVAQKIDIKDRE